MGISGRSWLSAALLAGATLTLSSARGESPEQVIRQLGAGRFSDRYAAERKILDNPEGLFPALQAGAESKDPELQARASRLLKIVQRRVLERQFERFRETGDRQFIPAGWERFSEVVGHSDGALALYLAMFLAHPDAMADAAAGNVPLQGTLQKVLADLGPWQQDSRHFDVVTFATILYLSSSPQCRVDRTSQQGVGSLLGLNPTQSAILHGDYHEELQRLLGQWFKRPDAAPPESRFHWAERYDLEEILVPALEMVSAVSEGRGDKNTIVAQAILSVARRGDVDHLEVLEPLLEDSTRFYERSNTTNGQRVHVTTEIRDVALLAAIHLTKQSPAAFGFEPLRSDKFLYMPETAGFKTPEARDLAFKKWETWKRLHWQGLNMAPVQAIEGESL